MSVQTVLVVEDEPALRELIRRSIERAGMQVVSTSSGAAALRLAVSAAPDLVILDLGLPDIAGHEVVEELRRRDLRIPVVVLTAMAGERDRIRAFENGADDYVVKPFSPRELVLRVQAILRRARGPDARGESVLSFGDGELRLDPGRREVTVRNSTVAVTPTEWGILTALAADPGRVLTRFELVNRSRGYEYDGYERTVDSHVRNLRRKLELDPKNPRIILTVTAAGYRLALPSDA